MDEENEVDIALENLDDDKAKYSNILHKRSFLTKIKVVKYSNFFSQVETLFRNESLYFCSKALISTSQNDTVSDFLLIYVNSICPTFSLFTLQSYDAK